MKENDDFGVSFCLPANCNSWMSKSMEFFFHKFIIVSIKYVYNLERNRSQHKITIRRGKCNQSESEGEIV